jgi:hypothetical protein
MIAWFDLLVLWSKLSLYLLGFLWLAFREDVRTSEKELKKLATTIYTFVLESPNFWLPSRDVSRN